MTCIRWAALALAAALAACGGGGGDSATPTEDSLTLSGTAVVGAALAGATVEVRCASGSGSGSTDAQGRFAISVAGGALPCVLKVPTPDGGALHSAIADSAGGNVTVNISPLTELVVAGAAGVVGSTLFDEFAARAAAVSAGALQAAVQQVADRLAGVVDLAGVNPITDTLAVGNPLDQIVESLNAKLAEAGTTLDQLTQAVAAASPVAPSPSPTDPDAGTSTTASVAAELLFAPAASNCPALRSGTYRTMDLIAGADFATGTVVFDAGAMTFTDTGGTSPPLRPIGPCRFTNDAGEEVVVSGAGVIVARAFSGTAQRRLILAFPEQTHALASMAGDWNYIGQIKNGAGFVPQAGSVSFDASGQVTASQFCADLKSCAADSTNARLAANPAGGFDLIVGTATLLRRVFAFKAGGGAMMVLAKGTDGSYSIWTRQRSNGLPSAGALSRSWNFNVDEALGVTSAVNESGNVIDTVDQAAGSYVRQSFAASGGTYPETILANQPRNGYTTRVAASNVPVSTGGTQNVREFVYLGLRGMGVTPVIVPATATQASLMVISVAQPGNVAWVAPELMSRAFASHCTAMRSGSYRIVVAAATDATPLGANRNMMTFDAATGTVTYLNGSTDRFEPSGPCRATSPTSGTQLVATQAGVLMAAGGNGGQLWVGIPVQAHTVAELAGTWNRLGYNAGEGPNGEYAVTAASVSFDEAGLGTAVSYCADVATCVPQAGLTLQLAPRSMDDGFDLSYSDQSEPQTIYAYRAGNGDLMLLQIGFDGTIGFLTQQRQNALPTVGTRTRSWDLSVSATGVASLGESANTIASVTAATGTVVRTRQTAGGATYSETVHINDPRNGYNFRVAATPTASDGSTVTVREFTSLSMRGMGFSPLKVVGADGPFLLVSVTQP